MNVFENDKESILPIQTNITAETDDENESKQSINVENIVANRLDEPKIRNNNKFSQLENEIFILFAVNFTILFPVILILIIMARFFYLR